MYRLGNEQTRRGFSVKNAGLKSGSRCREGRKRTLVKASKDDLDAAKCLEEAKREEQARAGVQKREAYTGVIVEQGWDSLIVFWGGKGDFFDRRGDDRMALWQDHPRKMTHAGTALELAIGTRDGARGSRTGAQAGSLTSLLLSPSASNLSRLFHGKFESVC